MNPYFKTELGELYNGDCVEVMSELPEKSIDLVVTSPPYNCGIEYDSYDDNMEWKDYYVWCEKWLKGIYRLLKDDGRFCLNHYLSLGQSNNRHAPLMKLNEMALDLGFQHHGIAIWTDITLTKRTAWGSWLSASAPYINPPYERKTKEAFIRKAYKESLKGNHCIMLLPVSTSTAIFHDVILPNCNIEFLRGRVKFIGINTNGEKVSDKCGQHDSMIIEFRR